MAPLVQEQRIRARCRAVWKQSRPPTVDGILAWGTAAVGLLSVVSALTPSLPARSDVIRGVLPPWAPAVAQLGALAFGLCLIWLSRALSRRKQRAWQLALALLFVVAGAHLAKGFDIEEAGMSLALAVALVRYRHRFHVPGDPTAWRPLLASLLALASVGAFLTVYGLHRLAVPEDLEDLATAAAMLLGVRALYLWLRPLSERVRQNAADRSATRGLVEAAGRDSLAFFALRRDKSYFFSPSRRAFLAYRVVGGAALVSGDPIGERIEFRPLLQEFRRVAHTKGWRVAVLGASSELLPVYQSLGLRSLRIGDEAVVRPNGFSLEGRLMRKVRQSVHRLRRQGYQARFLSVDGLTDATRHELEQLSTEWRGAWPERGFTMALDTLFAESGTVFALAEDASGRIGGFLHLAPSPGASGYSLSAMRRRRDTPNGLMEFLIAETMAWGRDGDVEEISLNFCVFAETLRAGNTAPPLRRALRFVLIKLDAVFQLQRLLSFSTKFQPEWRPRYLCFERVADLPLVGFAYLRLESLLTPPQPWTRRHSTRSCARSQAR